jgi:hypothetical protein
LRERPLARRRLEQRLREAGRRLPGRRGLIIGLVAAATLGIVGGLAALLFASGEEQPMGEEPAAEAPAAVKPTMVKLTALKAKDCLATPAGHSQETSSMPGSAMVQVVDDA